MLHPKFLAVYMGLLGAVTDAAVMSNPESSAYVVSAFASGDWGTTTYQGSCCSRSSTFNNFNVTAESVVASLMNIEAGKTSVPPKVIMEHGDSFYWTGINSLKERDSRFATTFEEKFNDDIYYKYYLGERLWQSRRWRC
ncbi:unnamed protein product [Peronospora belbahrii]|uniref:Uncharacterized protein n=1 Tax=Peronospora belbahrii TaxID=622444 RepID=A0AAU9KZ60_9STRA|nr:unnamed protein product [Peronospora belbahrii]CAH0516858.1 unnamed protein product [Peronospora belbahrii]